MLPHYRTWTSKIQFFSEMLNSLFSFCNRWSRKIEPEHQAKVLGNLKIFHTVEISHTHNLSVNNTVIRWSHTNYSNENKSELKRVITFAE